MYTASDAFFEALWELGITYCFVNLGTDHPALLEAIVKGQKEKPDNFPKVITCPNEMVALSMADGYARYTSKPQCVIIHVDVGTQGLGAAVHNASSGRAPVLIFAGLSPYTCEGELRGSRTEYIHWIQDVPDQKQIISQYCRYTGEIRRGVNVKQMVGRAYQYAVTAPMGPVYLMGSREAMEEEIPEYQIDSVHWQATGPAALPQDAVSEIAEALMAADEPLVITGYSGRNHGSPGELVQLANTIKGLRVLDTGGSDCCFPFDHPGALGLRYGSDESIRTADVILIADCDVPFIPTQCKPKASAKIYHIDSDPLKQQIPVFYVPSIARYRVDTYMAFHQLHTHILNTPSLSEKVHSHVFTERWRKLESAHASRLSAIRELATPLPDPDAGYSVSHLCSLLRSSVPEDTVFAVEAVTCTTFVADQIAACIPGTYINCGGGGLGWSGGGTLGIKLAIDDMDRKRHPNMSTVKAAANGDAELENPTNNGTSSSVEAGDRKPRMVVQIVGDGTFLFSVPGSVYWIARRYNIPVLTVVLNNKGWHAPRRSLLLVHPNGYGSRVDNQDLHISFGPTCPDFSELARAAAGGWDDDVKQEDGRQQEHQHQHQNQQHASSNGGGAAGNNGQWGKYQGNSWLWAGRARTGKQLRRMVEEAVWTVREESRAAVLDAVLAM